VGQRCQPREREPVMRRRHPHLCSSPCGQRASCHRVRRTHSSTSGAGQAAALSSDHFSVVRHRLCSCARGGDAGESLYPPCVIDRGAHGGYEAEDTGISRESLGSHQAGPVVSACIRHLRIESKP
jgi:hypothetical protein